MNGTRLRPNLRPLHVVIQADLTIGCWSRWPLLAVGYEPPHSATGSRRQRVTNERDGNGSTDTLNSELAGLSCTAKQAMRHGHQLRGRIPRPASREETLRGQVNCCADHPARYPDLQCCFPPSRSWRMNCLCGSRLLMPVQRSKLQEAECGCPLLWDGFHLNFSAKPSFSLGALICAAAACRMQGTSPPPPIATPPGDVVSSRDSAMPRPTNLSM
jgi:hypothetical protein